MVSQFKSSHQVNLLGDLDFHFPEGTHAVGRLDNHSEGLLILTTNNKLTRLLFLSEVPHKRTYLVQVNNILSASNLLRLQTGVPIRIKSGEIYTTPPCDVRIIQDPENHCHLGNRLTAFAPYTWLLITLTEGKYHQVRKMIGAVRHKCKRLIRVSIEELGLMGLQSGEVAELNEEEIFSRLKIVSG